MSFTSYLYKLVSKQFSINISMKLQLSQSTCHPKHIWLWLWLLLLLWEHPKTFTRPKISKHDGASLFFFKLVQRQMRNVIISKLMSIFVQTLAYSVWDKVKVIIFRLIFEGITHTYNKVHLSLRVFNLNSLFLPRQRRFGQSVFVKVADTIICWKVVTN